MSAYLHRSLAVNIEPSQGGDRASYSWDSQPAEIYRYRGGYIRSHLFISVAHSVLFVLAWLADKPIGLRFESHSSKDLKNYMKLFCVVDEMRLPTPVYSILKSSIYI